MSEVANPDCLWCLRAVCTWKKDACDCRFHFVMRFISVRCVSVYTGHILLWWLLLVGDTFHWCQRCLRVHLTNTPVIACSVSGHDSLVSKVFACAHDKYYCHRWLCFVIHFVIVRGEHTLSWSYQICVHFQTFLFSVYTHYSQRRRGADTICTTLQRLALNEYQNNMPACRECVSKAASTLMVLRLKLAHCCGVNSVKWRVQTGVVNDLKTCQ